MKSSSGHEVLFAVTWYVGDPSSTGVPSVSISSKSGISMGSNGDIGVGV